MRGWRAIGHSPLGALSVVALLGLSLFQVGTGLFNADNDGLYEGPLARLASEVWVETAHDLHEIAFNVLLVFIAIHVAAVLFYRLFLGKKLLGPMLTGRAALDPDVEPMRPARWWVALLCVVAALGLTRWIIAGAPPFGG
jgi:cytochrome b